MLSNHNSSAIVAVKDLDRSCEFYRDVLGLNLDDERVEEDVLTFRTGATKLIVYRSAEAGSNRANAVVWGVGTDLDAIVEALRSKGVVFKHYSQIGELEGDVHKVGSYKLVWFADPDGNILHLNNM
jgi:catechol 2,3-dioxygenase-like lactoylglutathione lyase family enzyme